MNSTAMRGISGLTIAGLSYVKGGGLFLGKPRVLRGVVRPDGVT